MIVNTSKIFGLLAKKGATQKMLADAINVSTGNVTDWKKGKSKPSAPVILKIAKYFDVPVESLYADVPTTSHSNAVQAADPQILDTEDAKRLVSIYNHLPEEAKKELMKFANYQLYQAFPPPDQLSREQHADIARRIQETDQNQTPNSDKQIG